MPSPIAVVGDINSHASLTNPAKTGALATLDPLPTVFINNLPVIVPGLNAALPDRDHGVESTIAVGSFLTVLVKNVPVHCAVGVPIRLQHALRACNAVTVPTFNTTVVVG